LSIPVPIPLLGLGYYNQHFSNAYSAVADPGVDNGLFKLTNTSADSKGPFLLRPLATVIAFRFRTTAISPSYTQDMSIVKDAAAIAKGMSITLKEVFQPTEVENYPDGKGPMRGAKFEQRFRGKHQLQRDENGLEKCVACFLCAAACPSNCIYIEAAENTEEKRISSAERYAKVYNIDYNRCIFCGYCVEACPTDAITHGHGFELASLNATTLVMRKEDLLVPTPTLPDVVTSAKDQAEILA
jgi:NADH-quinone oxidoreductase subunit I